MGLAERAGLHGPGRRARPARPETGGANAGLKVACLVAGMAAGADTIDDMDLLRHGAMDDAVRRGPRALHAGLVPARLHLGQRPPAGAVAPGVPGRPGRRGAAAARRGRRWPSSTSTPRRNGSTATPSRAPAFGHAKIQGILLVKGLNALAAVISTPPPRRSSARSGCAAGTPPPPAARPGWSPRRSAPPAPAGCTGLIIVRLDSGVLRPRRDQRGPAAPARGSPSPSG